MCSLLLLIALAAGCAQTASPPSSSAPPIAAKADSTFDDGRVTLTYDGIDDVAGSQGDDAALGLRHILAGDGLPVGLPLSLARIASPKALVADRGTFERYGYVPSPEGREDGMTDTPSLPLGLSSRPRTRGGATIANNCFTCHANTVGDGEGTGATVLLGAASVHVNQAAILEDYRAARATPGLALLQRTSPDAERDLFLRMGDDVLYPSAKYAQTRGENFGQWFVWWRIALLADPATTGLALRPAGMPNPELARLIESQELVPADPMPWWNRKYKQSSYWWGDPGGARHFAFSFNQPIADADQAYLDHIAVVERILAFADTTRSPSYPRALDAERVELGRALFHGEREIEAGGTLPCASCHGSYEPDDVGYLVDYPEYFAEEAGTDSAYLDVTVALQPLVDSVNQLATYFEGLGRAEDAPSVDASRANVGYLAPPLDGVWATAPYFHNGSVPTLYAVLDSRTRPAVWSRSLDITAYDYDRTGLVYDEESRQGVERPTYDTSRYGRGNGGHTFGDDMTDDERYAVIEFLKSLSGPGMRPR